MLLCKMKLRSYASLFVLLAASLSEAAGAANEAHIAYAGHPRHAECRSSGQGAGSYLDTDLPLRDVLYDELSLTFIDSSLHVVSSSLHSTNEVVFTAQYTRTGDALTRSTERHPGTDPCS